MAQTVRIRWLLRAVAFEEDYVAVRRTLMDFLSNIPMSHRELARELGVNHVTVGRWASGKTLPSLDTLRVVVGLVRSRVTRLQQQIEWMDQFLDALEDAAAHGTRDYKRSRAGLQKVQDMLEKRSAVRATRRRKARRKRKAK